MNYNLFSPLYLGPVRLENRIVVSPMCQYSAIDGNATEWHLQHLMNLGFSGAGLVMVEATAVLPEGRITNGCLGLYSEHNETALQYVISSVKKYAPQSVFGIQLAHSGRKGSTQRPWEGDSHLSKEAGGWQTVAPSAISFRSGDPIPRELTKNELERIKSAFIQSALKAVKIGFDVIEIHAAHGYLLHQFFSPLTNQRTDEYGGSLENRMRYILEVVEAVQKNIPKEKAIGLRITGSDWLDGGVTISDAVVLANELKKRNVQYACVSSGGIAPTHAIPIAPNYQLPFATAVKEGSNIITRTVGLIRDPLQANSIITEGKADLIAIGRAFLDNPRWAWHAADELGASISAPPQYSAVRSARWKKGI